jgi:hypothetical protein
VNKSILQKKFEEFLNEDEMARRAYWEDFTVVVLFIATAIIIAGCAWFCLIM